MQLEEIVWTFTSAGQRELGSTGSCSVNVNGGGSQAADGIRRERLGRKIAKWGQGRRQKYRWQTEEDGEVTDGVKLS